MASEKLDTAELNKQIVEKYQDCSKKVLHEILEQFKAISDEIQEEDFEDLEEAFSQKEAHIDFDKKKFAEKFKSSLFDEIKNELCSGWESNGISEKIRTLEYLKDVQTDGTKKFRPTGKSVQEQVKSVEIQMLLKKKQCLERHLKFQSEEMETMIQKCQEVRVYLNEFSKNRAELSKKIDNDQADLAEKEKIIREVSEKCNDFN